MGQIVRSQPRRSVDDFTFECILDRDKALRNITRRVSTVVVGFVSRPDRELVTEPKVGRPVKEKAGEVQCVGVVTAKLGGKANRVIDDVGQVSERLFERKHVNFDKIRLESYLTFQLLSNSTLAKGFDSVALS